MAEFLAKFTPQSSIDELQGHIYLLAKDQYGCRLLQRLLDEHKNNPRPSAGDASAAATPSDEAAAAVADGAAQTPTPADGAEPSSPSASGAPTAGGPATSSPTAAGAASVSSPGAPGAPASPTASPAPGAAATATARGSSSNMVDMTFNEVFGNINELMTDPFGNYVRTNPVTQKHACE